MRNERVCCNSWRERVASRSAGSVNSWAQMVRSGSVSKKLARIRGCRVRTRALIGSICRHTKATTNSSRSSTMPSRKPKGLDMSNAVEFYIFSWLQREKAYFFIIYKIKKLEARENTVTRKKHLFLKPNKNHTNKSWTQAFCFSKEKTCILAKNCK